MAVNSIEVTLMRGGTSKGVFVRLSDLPQRETERDRLVLALLGSPDPMQLDGLGGTHSSTSKVVAVGTVSEARRLRYEVPPALSEPCVTYLFGQVGIADPVVDWQGNCGNLTAAVAPFALHEGLIAPTGDRTNVALYNLNTLAYVYCEIPTPGGGAPAMDGQFHMPGVPGTGARLELVFDKPLSFRSNDVFPTGSRTEELVVGQSRVAMTIMDLGNPVAFVSALSLGLAGSELPAELNGDRELLERLERLRGGVAVRLGLAADEMSARTVSPAVPRVILVARPEKHHADSGDVVLAEDCDIMARMTSMGVVHHAFPGHGLIATAVAAALNGTVVSELVPERRTRLRLAHPKGVVSVAADVDDRPAPEVNAVSIDRTARRLLKGTAYLPPQAT